MKYYSFEDYVILSLLSHSEEDTSKQEIALEEKINNRLAEYEKVFEGYLENDESGLSNFFYEHDLQYARVMELQVCDNDTRLPEHIREIIYKIPENRVMLYVCFDATEMDLEGMKVETIEFLYADISNFQFTRPTQPVIGVAPTGFKLRYVLADEYEYLGNEGFKHSYCLETGCEVQINFDAIYCWFDKELYLSADDVE